MTVPWRRLASLAAPVACVLVLSGIASSAVVHVKQFSHGVGSDSAPVYSPDGTNLAFARSVFHADGTVTASVVIATRKNSELEVAVGSESVSAPRWSPDGTRLAFSRLSPELDGSCCDNYDVFVVDSDGTDLRNLTADDPQTNSQFTWSPDGTRVAYGGDGAISVVDVDGTGTTPLEIPDGGLAFEPAWSPTADVIAFRAHTTEIVGGEETSAVDIYSSPAAGGPPTRLTDDPAEDGAPLWSPDGTRLAFWSNRDGNSEIYVMNADGSAEMNVTADGSEDFAGSWSPDGTKIAYTRLTGNIGDIYVADAGGAGTALLVGDPGADPDVPDSTWDGDPSWSATGAVAFGRIDQGRRAPESEIWTRAELDVGPG